MADSLTDSPTLGDASDVRPADGYSMRRMHREEGQTLPEYGVTLSVIALAVVGVFTLLSQAMRAHILEIAAFLSGSGQ